MSKYEFEYDSWFRDDIPKAKYGSLQCWIENCLLYTSDAADE